MLIGLNLRIVALMVLQQLLKQLLILHEQAESLILLAAVIAIFALILTDLILNIQNVLVLVKDPIENLYIFHTGLAFLILLRFAQQIDIAV